MSSRWLVHKPCTERRVGCNSTRQLMMNCASFACGNLAQVAATPSATSKRMIGTAKSKSLPPSGYFCAAAASKRATKDPKRIQAGLGLRLNNAAHPSRKKPIPVMIARPAASRNETRNTSNSHERVCKLASGRRGKYWLQKSSRALSPANRRSDTKYKTAKLAAQAARMRVSRAALDLFDRAENKRTPPALASKNTDGWENQTAAAPMMA